MRSSFGSGELGGRLKGLLRMLRYTTLVWWAA